MQQQHANGNCIIVIPCNLFSLDALFRPLQIDKLYFWHQNTFNHPVTEQTLKYFLFHVQLFGATVYPDCPELGCSAINSSAFLNKGESAVSQIHYKGQLIYCRC
jgi:hypothetical protein